MIVERSQATAKGNVVCPVCGIRFILPAGVRVLPILDTAECRIGRDR